MSLPNLISLARLLAVPVMIYLILNGYYLAAFGLFVAAGVSDAVDGYIAKKMGQATVLGSYLDPLADKALLVGVYVTLGHAELLPTWLVILVVFRDILIVGGVVLLHISTNNVKMHPLIVSKINTVAQIVLVVVVLADLAFPQLSWSLLVMLMIYFVTATTLASGGAYIVSWGKNVDSKNGNDLQ
ncbi:MAG: CDP-alcohol phosphatidyltransferase [Rhodospirillaceae bacterium]|nr:CDP-alcohol phosphatidyltransferase [Rhodospirillaceae bacterium]|tara:strand:+ start:9614 stop:10168 length:555 start_codon:yes stop_codon:yes gene_type:complete